MNCSAWTPGAIADAIISIVVVVMLAVIAVRWLT